MKKIVIDKSELRSFSRQELVDKISHENVSLLLSIGADDLYNEMVPTGIICRFLVRVICHSKDKIKSRKLAIKFLRLVAPSTLLSSLPENEKTVVVGFNHPSLGEIFRLLYLGLEAYPDREFFFPVNIPWFENLAPVIPYLEAIGVYLTPMITPSTETKLEKLFADNEEILADAMHYKASFEKIYMKLAREMTERNAIIVVAPSATRQASVFIDDIARRGEGHIHPTMTILAHAICKKEDCGVIFAPVVVFEPKNNDRKLNLFKNYDIKPCQIFTAKDIIELSSGHSRDFDYQFLKRIDDIYSKR